MLRDVVAFLRCPVCGSGLNLSGAALRCATGHSFDVARQGYVSLVTGCGRTDTADTTAMVLARERFLTAGHYAPIRRAVSDACEWSLLGRAGKGRARGCVVDVGAGTGYYLAHVLDRIAGPAGVALEISPPALRRAARAHARIGAVGCNAWRRLPLRTSAAVAVLNVFAPRNGPEFARILEPGGVLVVVTPTSRHLAELVGLLGLITIDPRKDQRLHEKLGPWFQLTGRHIIDGSMSLHRTDVADLVEMGPSARHLDAGTIRSRADALAEPFGVTSSVTVSVYRRRDPRR